MSKCQIDICELNELLRNGMTVRGAAKHYRCSPGWISQLSKQGRTAVVRVAAMERGREIVERDESIIGDFRKMIARVEKQLTSLEDDLDNMKGEEKRLHIDSLVKCIGEQRKLNSSLTEIISTWQDHILLNEFKQSLVEIFKTYDPDIQKKIRAAIEQRGIIPAILRTA